MRKKISVKQFDFEYFKKMEINNTNRVLGGGCSYSDGHTYTTDVHTDNSDRASNDNGGADDGKAGAEDATTKKGTTNPPAFFI